MIYRIYMIAMKYIYIYNHINQNNHKIIVQTIAWRGDKVETKEGEGSEFIIKLPIA